MQKSEEVGVVPDGGQAAKSRLYTFTVGIAATGHPPALKRLLETVLSEPTGFGLRKDVLDVMWTSHNLLSSDPDQRSQSNHGTDELMVIRSELLPELPHGVVNDGAYIAGRIREMGFRVGYEPGAVVQIDVPRRMIDLI